MNVALLLHRVGPYHFARLKAAGQVLPTLAVELSRSDETYAWDLVQGADGFGRITLFETEDSRRQPNTEIIRRVRSALSECQPKVVVVPGWADTAALAAVQWCLNHQVPAVVMSESTQWDEKRVAGKEWIKSRIVKLCSASLAGGTPHSDYLVKLGMPRGRIFLGYDAVDSGYFSAKADESRKQETEVRKQHGLPERYFLASARFIEKKNLSRLIQAYARYRNLAGKRENGPLKSDTWHLVLLGDGPLKADLCRLISDLNLRDFVHMPGFVQYPDLPAYYGLADAFVHASTTEQWGLVVNEAMASGLPVLVSKRCGCAQDLVREGVNGFTFDPYNVDQLAGLLLKISAFNFPLSAFVSESRQIISKWGPERFAQGLKGAVDATLSSPPPRANLLDKLLLAALLRRHAKTES